MRKYGPSDQTWKCGLEIFLVWAFWVWLLEKLLVRDSSESPLPRPAETRWLRSLAQGQTPGRAPQHGLWGAGEGMGRSHCSRWTHALVFHVWVAGPVSPAVDMLRRFHLWVPLPSLGSISRQTGTRQGTWQTPPWLAVLHEMSRSQSTPLAAKASPSPSPRSQRAPRFVPGAILAWTSLKTGVN